MKRYSGFLVFDIDYVMTHRGSDIEIKKERLQKLKENTSTIITLYEPTEDLYRVPKEINNMDKKQLHDFVYNEFSGFFKEEKNNEINAEYFDNIIDKKNADIYNVCAIFVSDKKVNDIEIVSCLPLHSDYNKFMDKVEKNSKPILENTIPHILNSDFHVPETTLADVLNKAHENDNSREINYIDGMHKYIMKYIKQHKNDDDIYISQDKDNKNLDLESEYQMLVTEQNDKSVIVLVTRKKKDIEFDIQLETFIYYIDREKNILKTLKIVEHRTDFNIHKFVSNPS